jgi:hypothetical protein
MMQIGGLLLVGQGLQPFPVGKISTMFIKVARGLTHSSSVVNCRLLDLFFHVKQIDIKLLKP